MRRTHLPPCTNTRRPQQSPHGPPAPCLSSARSPLRHHSLITTPAPSHPANPSRPRLQPKAFLLRFARSAHSITQGDIVYSVDVGKRGRQRAEQARIDAVRPVDRMARVNVSDETWAAFRAQLGVTPVSVGLGELVERAVAVERRRSASDVEGVRVALEDARLVASELASLIARLERTILVAGDG